MVGLGWVPPWWRRLVRLSAPLGRSSDHESAFAFAFVSSTGPLPPPSPHLGNVVGSHSKAGRDRPRNHHPQMALRSRY